MSMQDVQSSHSRLAACILAAGQGSRMGNIPKAAIRIRGRSILEWQISALRSAGVRDVSVVVGPYKEHLSPLVSLCGAELVVNASEGADILSSQIAAVSAHHCKRPGHDLMVVLGDLPFLQSQHFLRLRCLWQSRPSDIHGLVPMADGTRGHPLMLSWQAVQDIVRSDAAAKGIRGWLLRNDSSVQFLEMGDPAYVQDLDTPHDLGLIEGGFELPVVR